ncbi:TPA: MFS transporter, partial [Providencia rettgeri]
TAHFAAYSYIEPFVRDVAHQSQNFATVLLLIFGAAGIIGSVIFSRYSTKLSLIFLPSAIALMTLCLLLLLPMGGNVWSLIILSVFWGIAMMCISLGMQVKVIDLAPDATDLAMAIFSGIFNIGIGGGALLGNQVIVHMGMTQIGYVGAIIGVMSLIWCLYLFKRYSQTLTDKLAPAEQH